MNGLRMSGEQLESLVREKIDRMADDSDLASWLPDVAGDLSGVEVGVWRCVQGDETDCANVSLWESPLSWEPACGHCGRLALLVEVVGRIDYTSALAA